MLNVKFVVNGIQGLKEMEVLNVKVTKASICLQHSEKVVTKLKKKEIAIMAIDDIEIDLENTNQVTFKKIDKKRLDFVSLFSF